MKGKFHINSKGEPGACSASNGSCPFGEHYSTIEEAQKAYDEAWGESHLRSLNKTKKASKKKLSDFDREAWAEMDFDEPEALEWKEKFDNPPEAMEWRDFGFTPEEAALYKESYEPYKAFYIKHSRDNFFTGENFAPENYILIDPETGSVFSPKSYVIDAGDIDELDIEEFESDPEPFLNYENVKVSSVQYMKDISNFSQPVLYEYDTGLIVDAKNVHAVDIANEIVEFDEILESDYAAAECAYEQGFPLWL